MSSPLLPFLLVHEVEEQGNDATVNLIVKEGNVLLLKTSCQVSKHSNASCTDTVSDLREVRVICPVALCASAPKQSLSYAVLHALCSVVQRNKA